MGVKEAYETPTVDTTEDTQTEFEVLLDGPLGTALDRIERITDDADLATIMYADGKAKIVDAVRLAVAVKQLEGLMTGEVMKYIRFLAGNIIGFRTDKDHTEQGYTDEVLKRCVISALLSGYQVINNEFNVIGGNFYAAKNGLQRLCNEVPGVSGLHCVVHGEPVLKTGKGRVEIVVKWHELGSDKWETLEFLGDRAINVRLNQGMAGDGAIGKATRKALNTWHQSQTGRRLSPVGEPTEDAPPEDVQAAINGDQWTQTFDKDGLPTDQRSKVDEL